MCNKMFQQRTSEVQEWRAGNWKITIYTAPLAAIPQSGCNDIYTNARVRVRYIRIRKFLEFVNRKMVLGGRNTGVHVGIQRGAKNRGGAVYEPISLEWVTYPASPPFRLLGFSIACIYAPVSRSREILTVVATRGCSIAARSERVRMRACARTRGFR